MMAITGGISAAGVGIRTTIQSASEEDREQVNRINLTTPDSIRADATRRDGDWALGRSLADRPTILDHLRDGPSTLDRFS
jgi:hypothetical protein